MKRLSLLFVIIFLQIGCDYFDNSLIIHNKFPFAVAVEVSNEESNVNFNDIEYYINNFISRDSVVNLVTRGKMGAWEKYVNGGKSKKLFIYVFNLDTLIKYRNIKTMNDLLQSHKCLNHFKYSIPELEKKHWKITISSQ